MKDWTKIHTLENFDDKTSTYLFSQINNFKIGQIKKSSLQWKTCDKKVFETILLYFIYILMWAAILFEFALTLGTIQFPYHENAISFFLYFCFYFCSVFSLGGWDGLLNIIMSDTAGRNRNWISTAKDLKKKDWNKWKLRNKQTKRKNWPTLYHIDKMNNLN